MYSNKTIDMVLIRILKGYGVTYNDVRKYETLTKSYSVSKKKIFQKSSYYFCFLDKIG